MKTLKKYFKVAVLFVAFAICSLMLAFTPNSSAYALISGIVDSNETTLKGLQTTTVELKDSSSEFKVPMPESGTVRILHNGKNKDYVVGATDNDTAYFDDSVAGYLKVNRSALTHGKYKVVYISSDKKYYSLAYEIDVNDVDYTISFEKATGEKGLVKTHSKTNEEIVLPKAKIKEDDSKIVSLVVKIESGATIATTETTDGFKFTPTEAGKYSVRYSFDGGKNTPSKTFTITVSDNFETPKEFDLVNTPSYSDLKIELGKKDIKLKELSFKSEIDSDIDVNYKSVVVYKVGAENTTKYELNPDGKMNNLTFDFTTENFGGSYDKNASDSITGNYKVKYVVEDVYGRTHEEIFDLGYIQASSKPEIKLAYNYDVTDGVVSNLNTEDTVIDLKSYMGREEIILPAAYASDLTTKYSDLVIVRTLYHVDSNTTYYIDNVEYDADGNPTILESTDPRFNHASDANTTSEYPAVNKFTTFKFGSTEGKAGNYTLKYFAFPKSDPTRKSVTTSYSFNIVTDSDIFSDNQTTPEATLTVSDYNIGDKEIDVKFTAVDKHADDDHKKYVDANLKKKVFFYDESTDSSTAESQIAGIISAIKDNFETYASDYSSNVLDNAGFVEFIKTTKGYANFQALTKSDKTNTYTIDTTKTSAKSIVVVAVALNDYGKLDIKTERLALANIDDTEAPVATVLDENDLNDSGYATGFVQGTKISLPNVKFVDALDNSLAVSVKYYINSPVGKSGVYNYLDVDEMQPVLNNTITGAKLNLVDAGDYVIIYTASDDNGNTRILQYSFTVVTKDVVSLGLEIAGREASSNTVTIKVGESVTFKPTVYKNGVADSSLKAELTDIKCDETKVLPEQLAKENCYRFTKPGTYTFTYRAELGSDYDTKSFVVIVENVDLVYENSTEIENYFKQNNKANKDEVFFIPMLRTNIYSNPTIEVTKSGSKRDVVEVENGWNVEVIDDLGTYVVKYTNSTEDQTITKTFEIKIGDGVAPVITMNEDVKSKLQESISYDGEHNISYKLTYSNRKLKVKAVSNGETLFEEDFGLAITDRTNTGTVVDLSKVWSNLKYELTGSNISGTNGDYTISGTGDYTLTITTTDENGNKSDALEIKFSVVNKTDEKKANRDTVVGVVLIVISLVVLAGVILFFLLTGKKSKPSNKKKEVSSKNETNNNQDSESLSDENVVVEDKAEGVEVVEESTDKDDKDAE